MGEKFEKFMAIAVKDQEQAAKVMKRLFAVAQPGAVFSEPVTVGDHSVITAAEVKVGAGFGYGSGGGTGPSSAEAEAEDEQVGAGAGFGGGGGGGGVSGGRPVAVIDIGPSGVRVEPVVDVTKISLALFTTLGSMLLMLGRMRRPSKR